MDRWGKHMFCSSGLRSSSETLQTEARSTHSASIKQRLTLILSFAWTMNMLTTSWWFVMETLGPAGPDLKHVVCVCVFFKYVFES